MEIHNILSLCYGGYNLSYAKDFTFNALRKTQFLKAKQEYNVESDRFERINDFVPKSPCFISKPTNHTKSTVCIDFYGKQILGYFANKAVKE